MTRARRAALLCSSLALLSGTARGDHTPDPSSVTIIGSFQSELGCPGDWMPTCVQSRLSFQNGVWQGDLAVPAGHWQYKVALDDSFDENYGDGGVQDGPNIPLFQFVAGGVRFYYDHRTHWATDHVRSIPAIVVGSFQSELGCAGDWMPNCYQSWLQDPDLDGLYSFRTDMPAGAWEAKVVLWEDFQFNYGAGGQPGGPNIPFTVPGSAPPVLFLWQSDSKRLEVLLQLFADNFESGSASSWSSQSP